MADPYASFSSRVIPLAAENVDTDQIVPARFLKTTDKQGLADALFRDWRFEADGSLKQPAFVLDQPEMTGRRILLAGDNFGCGSSREHAPWALVAWGITAVITTSCADIFQGNALKNGLLPVIVDAVTHEILLSAPGTRVSIDLEARTLSFGDARVTFEIDPFARQCLLQGVDELGFLLAQEPVIAAWERKEDACAP